MSTQNPTGTKRVMPNYDACIDCGACEVACQRTWDLPPETDRIEVIPVEHGTERETNNPMQCYNCAEAPCVGVCPTDALFFRDNGTVRVTADKCIGCHYCGVACPFGAPQYPGSEVPEAEEADPTGVRGGGLMDKCTTCEPRQEEGLDPACVSECPTNALLFGTPQEVSTQLREQGARTHFSQAAASIIFGADAEDLPTED